MERATLELAEDLKRQFRDRDELYRDIDAVLFGELPVEIPEAYRKTAIEVRSPLALHIASTVTAALSVNPMSTVFKPIGFGDTYQSNSTLRENFFEASWKRQENEAKRQLLRLFLWSMAVKGEGVLKTLERSRSAWSDYDTKAKQLQADLDAVREYDQDMKDRLYDRGTENLKLSLPYPIATTDVPPETFYYTKNENGLTSVVEIKDLPYMEALEKFGAGLNASGDVIAPHSWSELDPRAMELARGEWSNMMHGGSARSGAPQTIRCIEAWDYKVQVILLRAEPAPAEWGLGDATLCRVRRIATATVLKSKGPYFHSLGITGPPLRSTPGLSILFGFLRLFPLLDSLLTMQGNAAYMTGTRPSSGPRRGRPCRELRPCPTAPTCANRIPAPRPSSGQALPFDVNPIDQPKVVSKRQLIGSIKEMLELALPSVVQGVVASDQSGYALNQAAYLARLGWDPIVSNAEVTLGDRVGFESWLIENRIGEKVYAWGELEAKKGKKTIGGQTKAAWLGIGPDELQGVHRYEAKLAPSTPSNEIIEVRAIGEKMQLKLITYEDAVERAGGNPDEVEKSWLLHDLKNSEEIQTELKTAILQKIATIRSERMAAAGLPPAPGMAGVGSAGVPGGTPGTPPMGGVGGMPPNPVPSPGQGLPMAPPPPGGGGPGMPPGGIPGGPVVPGPPGNAIPLPGGG
jgi:hypothetical protein